MFLPTKMRLPARTNNAQNWKGHECLPSSLLKPSPSEGMIPQVADPHPVHARASRPFLSGWARQLSLWLCVIFFSVVSYCLCNRFLITSVVIQGKSMLPTLREGEHYLLDRLHYRRHLPARGDLVVFRDPGHTDYAIKRIIALPGETVALRDGKIFVNNALLPEPYLPPKLKTFLPDDREKLTLILGHDQYFVLGDNRMVSEDSRFYGPVSRKQIIGNLAFK